ncbi:MAG: protein kinase [Gemmatimonadota bacterium]
MTDAFSRLSTALADRYRIEQELGQGGMATVYLAHDVKHDRQVAIKVLRPELAAVLGAERFVQEIKTTAALQHPHILPLFDSGIADGFLFYVMPFIDGETLRAKLDRETQLGIAEAVKITTDVADALHYAHSRGIIHRDIKPENILLANGRPMLADFGIALAVRHAGGERITGTGLSLGTPHYMSPEQATGDRNLDARSDIYSLGALTYEMLAGEPPITGPKHRAIVARLLTETPRSLRVVRDVVPVGMDAAILRALAKDPADRFDSAAQFAQALTGGASAPAVPPRARRPNRLVLFAAMLALVAAVAAGWVLLRRPAVPRIERIAVLPMDNQTGDSTQAFFADGMTRELIAVLTDAGVRVLGHRAVAAYRNTTLPAREIANQLRVDAIVTGAVLRAGNQVQVAAELTDPATGENLWARTFSRPAEDVVALQHDVAAEIARGIQARLTPDQKEFLGEARPVNPRAYDLYLLGQEQANLRTTEGFQRSVEYISQSLALDSTFAPAWSTLAIANAYALIYQTTRRDSARIAVERAARRAMELDDRLGDPYYALGATLVHNDWDFERAAELFRRGKERTLSTQAVALYGWTAWETGNWAAEIDRTAKQLVELEPTTAQWRSDLAWWYWSSRDSAAARAAAESAIAMDSRFYEAFDILSLIEMDARNFTAAERYHKRAIELAGGDYWVRQFNDGMIAAARGDRAAVEKVVRELEGDPRLAQRAGLLYLLGNKDSMYTLFDHAVEARDLDLLQVMNAMPFLYPIRKEPRYLELQARIGLPEALR